MSELINLAIGQPSPDLLRPELLAQAARHCFGSLDPEELNYGDCAGNAGFLEALAAFLTEHYRLPVSPRQLFLTAGASQGIDLACRVYCRPGDTILVEEPTYFLALEIFASHGLHVEPVAMDEHGLRPDALRTVLQRHRPKLLYTIPLHHNPTAVSLPAARRDKVLELARAHDVVVLADEVYQLLHFDAANPPPAPFGARAAQGGVVSVGSFSKILAPAMRVGWIQADPDTVARFGRDGMIQSGGAINQIGSLLVRSVLRSGLQQAHLNELIAVLGRRARAMHEALVEHMPEGVHWTRPDGGYFFWLRYPPQVDTARLLAPAQALGAGFHPGARFSSAGGQSHCLRLSFARYDEGAIALGVQRLAQASAALMEAGG